MDLTGIMAQNPEMASLGAGAIGGALAAIGTVFIIFTVLIGALMIVSRWRIFEKAELPGRGALIPILQRLLDVQACGKTRMDTATPSSSGGWSLSNRCSVQNLQEVREN